jgi:hypothetical protein
MEATAAHLQCNLICYSRMQRVWALPLHMTRVPLIVAGDDKGG